MPLRKIYIILFLFISLYSNAQPLIISFSPRAATIGSTITINGTGFNTDKTKNLVWIGSVQATVLSASSTQLSIVVPQGACNGIVSVTNNGLTGESNRIFSTLFRKINATDTIQFGAAVKLTDPITDGNASNEFIDIDRDGRVDLVHYALNKKQIIIRRNISNGNQFILDTNRYVIDLPSLFIADQLVPGRPIDIYNYLDVKSTDFDGDGSKDICLIGSAILSRSFNYVFLGFLKNQSTSGKIQFLPANITCNFDIDAYRPSILTIKDFNKDGKPDFLLMPDKPVIGSPNILNAFFTNGRLQYSGNLLSIKSSINYAPANIYIGLNAIDFNDDGRPELFKDVALTDYKASFEVFQNKSNSNSLNQVVPRFYTSRFTTSRLGIKVVDFNNDGKQEIGFMSFGLVDTILQKLGVTTPGPSRVHSLTIFQNLSTIDTVGIGNQKELFFDSVLKGVRVFEVADLNSDQLPDLIFARSDTNAISVFINRSTASEFKFSNPIHLSYSPNSTNINSIKLSDLNGDGIPDIVLQNLDGSLYILNNTTGFQDTVYRNALPTVIEPIVVTNKVYSMWPNPTKNILYLEKPITQSTLYVELSTLNGQRVALISPSVSAQSNYMSINVSTLVSGIYVVKVFDLSGLIFSKQFIKQ
ncbi:MAG: FG-GAP-like repeat-containing protein [Bacteroidota bacterium]|jgi:hypothetical protein